MNAEADQVARDMAEDTWRIERQRIVDFLREQAVARFDEFGGHDARGAAFWDAACGLDPDDGGRVPRLAVEASPTVRYASMAESGALPCGKSCPGDCGYDPYDPDDACALPSTATGQVS